MRQGGGKAEYTDIRQGLSKEARDNHKDAE